jgi:hypothetical protein
MEVPTMPGHRVKETIGERWDPRKLRRVREDGWFRQHEAEMIASARRRRDASADAGPRKPATESEYEDALRRAKAIVARAMDLIRDVDRPRSPGPK